jgi:very-short-patch-repair endonuclease
MRPTIEASEILEVSEDWSKPSPRIDVGRIPLIIPQPLLLPFLGEEGDFNFGNMYKIILQLRSTASMKNEKHTSNLVKERARELRKTMTPAEELLWQQLRGRKLSGLKFRRQHPIGTFIVDFYCGGYSLIIEVDGGIHAAQGEYDTQRTQELVDFGYRVLRFTNQEVEEAIDSVLCRITATCRVHKPSPSMS